MLFDEDLYYDFLGLTVSPLRDVRLLVGTGSVLAVILVFTQNLLISLYAMLTIVLIVITLMGFLFAVAGFTFGAIEAVGVTIFVGMSVDYCLHVAHGYHSSASRTRKDKTTESLTALGVSILGAAMTTASSSAFLFPCRIYLFIQLGVMLVSNTILAVFFALVFLVAMLMIAGPVRVSPQHHRQWCDIISVVLCDCFRPENYKKHAKTAHKNSESTDTTTEKGAQKNTETGPGFGPASNPLHRGSGGAPLPRQPSKNMTTLPPLPAAPREVELATVGEGNEGKGAGADDGFI